MHTFTAKLRTNIKDGIILSGLKKRIVPALPEAL
nr:MAG TPA: hypothetical protein [Caudoviricetes sp.]